MDNIEVRKEGYGQGFFVESLSPRHTTNFYPECQFLGEREEFISATLVGRVLVSKLFGATAEAFEFTIKYLDVCPDRESTLKTRTVWLED